MKRLLNLFKRKKKPSLEAQLEALINSLNTAARQTATQDYGLTLADCERFLDLARQEFLALPRPVGLTTDGQQVKAVRDAYKQAHKQALVKHFSFTPAMGEQFIKQLEAKSEH